MSDTLSNWKAAVAFRKHFEDALEAVTAFEEKLAQRHRETCPLAPSIVKAIWDLYDAGRPLCCKAGRENLQAITGLDEYWLEYINHHAYEGLGCGGGWGPGERHYEDGKQRLHRILTGQIE